MIMLGRKKIFNVHRVSVLHDGKTTRAWLHKNVNVLNTIELALQNVKMVKFYVMYIIELILKREKEIFVDKLYGCDLLSNNSGWGGVKLRK